MRVQQIRNFFNSILEMYTMSESLHVNVMTLRLVIITGAITSGFKIVVGIVLGSAVWIYSGVYSIILVAARILLLEGIKKHLRGAKRHKRITLIAVMLMVSALLFDYGAMFRQFSKSGVVRYPAWVVILASIYFVAFFVVAILGITQTRKKPTIEFFANKIFAISAALMNMVLLQRMILASTEMVDSKITAVNSIFSYIIGWILLAAAAILLVKSLRANYDK